MAASQKSFACRGLRVGRREGTPIPGRAHIGGLNPNETKAKRLALVEDEWCGLCNLSFASGPANQAGRLRYELAAFNILISRTFIEVYHKKILSMSQNCRLDLMRGDR